MLCLFLLQIIITGTCTLCGILFYLFFQKNTGPEVRPVIFYPATGLVVITLFCQIWSLTLPVNSYCFLFVIAFLLILLLVLRYKLYSYYHYFKEQSKKIPRLSVLLALSLWFMILVLSSGPTGMDDTESYHIQMAKWIHEYGTVPGIANLHERFGFNSSWFATISLFIPSSDDLNFYTILNGTISLWYILFLIFKFTPLFDQTNK